MPRGSRSLQGGYCYHVLNRGNARQQVFHKPEDYWAWLHLICDASERQIMRLLAYCVMPNHFHFVLWPYGDEDISRWMQWLMTSHVRRYHRHYHSSGHIWQGRFKHFPIQQDDHLLTVIRYVERNPVRSNLVMNAGDWPWSSAATVPAVVRAPELDPGPAPRGKHWLQYVNQPLTEAELKAVRRSVIRGTPFGSEPWQLETATALGLESTLRPRGRPRKTSAKEEA